MSEAKRILTNPGNQALDLTINGTLFHFPPSGTVEVDETIADECIRMAFIAGGSLTGSHPVIPPVPATMQPEPAQAAAEAPVATPEPVTEQPVEPKPKKAAKKPSK